MATETGLGHNQQRCPNCGAVISRYAELCMSCGVKPAQADPPPPSSPAGEAGASSSPVGLAPAADTRRLPFLAALALAASGGVLGILGAIEAEIAGSSLLLPAVWAPVIEELAKPLGVYIILARWPATLGIHGTLGSKLLTAMFACFGGIAFALVESTVYMNVYFRDHTQSDLVFRYTVPVAIHALASFVFGLGICREAFVPRTASGRPPWAQWGFFAAAMGIHSVYNITVTVLGIVTRLTGG